MEQEQETVEVIFVTTQAKFKVTEKPFRVPAQLARYGLSAVINHLLDLKPPVAFDFLINNVFLRTSLQQYLKDNNLTTEVCLTIEYVEALGEPKLDQTFKHDDWVSCVAQSSKNHILSGSYDGKARIWNRKGECIFECAGHESSIKSISLWKGDERGFSFATASKDQTVRIWEAKLVDRLECKTVLICRGHTSSVETIACHPVDKERLATGGWDRTIKIWNTTQIAEGASTKKRKVDVKESLPVSSINAHTQCVSSLTWTAQDELISTSWDFSIKQWDVNTSTAKLSLNGNKTILCASYNQRLQILATGNSDNSLKLWDTRSQESSLVLNTLSSHKQWVSSVAWHPSSENLLLSGSYEGTVKLWDVRSKIPLHTLKKHEDKVLDVDWFDEGNTIASGGADGMLHLFKSSSQ